jgi:hypothetical protein
VKELSLSWKKKNPFQEGVERDEVLKQNHNQPLLAKELV